MLTGPTNRNLKHLTSWFFISNEERVKIAQDVLQITEEQLHREVETEQNVEMAIKTCKENLEYQREREAFVKRTREE